MHTELPYSVVETREAVSVRRLACGKILGSYKRC